MKYEELTPKQVKVVNFLVGQVLRSLPAANPKRVRELVIDRLENTSLLDSIKAP